MLAKCIITVYGDDVAEAYPNYQLCSGLKAGIKGVIHSMSQMWDDHRKEDIWEILLVDVWNASNEMNHQAMLQNMQHFWGAGVWFTFNTSRHQHKLVLRGHTDLVLSKEEVSQGEPLTMIIYTLALLPATAVIETLLEGLTFMPKQLQKWFADNSALARLLMPCKHELDKSILANHEKTWRQQRKYLVVINSNHGKGISIFVTSFGAQQLAEEYVAETVEGWVDSIVTFSKMTPHQLHAAFMVYACWLYSKWVYLQ
eukprot:6028207-Ditylum_brightwellii.AAC.1